MIQNAAIRSTGACGDTASYLLYTNDTMLIFGKGSVCLSGIGGIDSVKRIWVDNGITQLADYSFGICRNLEEINLPNSLAVIGRGPFNGCTKLTQLTLPKGVKQIIEPESLRGNGVRLTIDAENPNFYAVDGSLFEAKTNKMIYYRNNGETRYEVPANTKALGDEVFFKSGLEEIVFPEGLEVFGYYCLASCERLKSVTFPSTTKAVYEGVVDGCHSLEQMVCLAPVPPETAEFQTFSDLNSNIPGKEDWFKTPLYVPRAAIEAYKADSEWGQFEQILAVEDLP